MPKNDDSQMDHNHKTVKASRSQASVSMKGNTSSTDKWANSIKEKSATRNGGRK